MNKEDCRDRSKEKERYKTDEAYAERRREAAKRWKLKNKDRNKEINKIWKQTHKENVKRTSQRTYLAYCISTEYELIENYDKAKADNFNGWECHHRLELHPDCSIRFTQDSLKRLGLFLNRPANELIFLKKQEHAKIHAIGKWNE